MPVLIAPSHPSRRGEAETIRTIITLAAAFALLAPLSAADTQYVTSQVIPTAFMGYAVTSGHDYELEGLAQGSLVTVAVHWDSQDDVRILVVPPAGSCQVTPAPDLDCTVGGRVGSTPSTPSCVHSRGDATRIASAGPHQVTNSFTASRSGTWTVSVQHAGGVTVLGDLPYTLILDVYGSSPWIDGPQPQSWVNNDPHCWTPVP